MCLTNWTWHVAAPASPQPVRPPDGKDEGGAHADQESGRARARKQRRRLAELPSWKSGSEPREEDPPRALREGEGGGRVRGGDAEMGGVGT